MTVALSYKYTRWLLLFFKTTMIFFYFLICVYSILSVYSLHMIIKIQKRSVIRFLDQDFQTTEGTYHLTHWLTISVHISLGGFYRPLDEENRVGGQVPPYRERRVPMTDEDDVDKEHVLYAKM